MLSFLRVSIRCVAVVGLLASQLAMAPLAGSRADDPFADKPSPEAKPGAAPAAGKSPAAAQPSVDPFDGKPLPDAKPAAEERDAAAHAPPKLRYRMEADKLETMLRSRTDLQEQIAKLNLKIASAKLLSKSAAANAIPEDEIDAAIAKDPQFLQAALELADLIRKQRELEIAPGGPATDAALARVKDSIKVTRESIDEMRSAARPQVVEELKRQHDGSRVDIHALEAEQKLLLADYEATTQAIVAQAEAVEKLKKFNGDADQLRDDIESLRGVIREMGGTVTKWTIELDAEPRVRVIEPAGPAVAVAPARRFIVAGVAALVAFVLTLLGIILAAFVWRKVRGASDAVGGAGVKPYAAPSAMPLWIVGIAFLIAFFCGGICGAVGWFLLPTQYESSASLLVRAKDPVIWMQAEGEVDFETYKRNQVALIKSPLVINKALEDKSLMDNPIMKSISGNAADWLADSLIVDIDNGELMHVSLRDGDATDIPPIVNAVVVAYMKEVVEKERTDKLGRLDNLNRKLSAYKSQLHEKQQQLYIISQ